MTLLKKEDNLAQKIKMTLPIARSADIACMFAFARFLYIASHSTFYNRWLSFKIFEWELRGINGEK